MKTWICIKKCYWGATPNEMRIWTKGETVQSEDCPNKHFINPNKVEETFEFDKKESKEITVEDMELMTKKQINDKFELGLDENGVHWTKKKEMIKMVINKTKVLPKA